MRYVSVNEYELQALRRDAEELKRLKARLDSEDRSLRECQNVYGIRGDRVCFVTRDGLRSFSYTTLPLGARSVCRMETTAVSPEDINTCPSLSDHAVGVRWYDFDGYEGSPFGRVTIFRER